mmetsp:Transcript_11240/g.39027  ORF Transcript_11240/g.39027 Transcript_11240/m.39027 type:complete len:346 (-) Transcript_11240:1763-2800(-)
MNLACRLFCRISAWRDTASARVSTDVCSRSRCFGTQRIVASTATPQAPRPTRHMRNSLPPSASSGETSMVPRPGVTIFSANTCSSHGGSDAPVPCAPTCTKPPICCCAMEARFSSVRLYGARASRTCSTRAPHWTRTVRLSTSTSRIWSHRAKFSMEPPATANATPFGDSVDPHGRRGSRHLWCAWTTRSTSATLSGVKTHRGAHECVFDQLVILTSSSSPSHHAACADASAASTPSDHRPTDRTTCTVAASGAPRGVTAANKGGPAQSDSSAAAASSAKLMRFADLAKSSKAGGGASLAASARVPGSAASSRGSSRVGLALAASPASSSRVRASGPRPLLGASE